MPESKNPNIFETTFIVCDVETTGLSAYDNRVTEVAFIKVRNGEILGKYTTLVNPGQHIPREITNLTGITNEDVFNKQSFAEITDDILDFIGNPEEDHIVFTGHNVGFDYKFIQQSFFRAGLRFEMKSLCTCKLARRLLRRLKSKSLSNVAAHYDIKIKKAHRAYDDALATTKILLNFLEILTEEHEFENINEVLKYQNTKIFNNDNKSPVLKRLNLTLKDFPRSPGVYFMKAKDGEIIYIGKAKNLRERISSYFRFNSELPVKLRKLLNNIASIEYEVTNSELSALILESKLIKQHKPRFNSAIKRFRYHPYLKIDVQNDYPRIEKVYEIENDGANYYGPFRSGLTVNRLLKDIDDEFKLRKCDYKKLKPSKDHSTCMYYEMKKCNAPCDLTQSKSGYSEEVRRVHDFITSTEKHSAHKLYETKMTEHSENLEFERAAFIRDRLNDILKVMSYQKVITSAINDKKIIIKCSNETGKEIFFIQNGKLVKTYNLDPGNEFDQTDIFEELTETTEYLFFSLSKYVRHRFNNYELDEIKVISNWLALNRDRNSVMEIHEHHSKNEVLKFLSV